MAVKTTMTVTNLENVKKVRLLSATSCSSVNNGPRSGYDIGVISNSKEDDSARGGEDEITNGDAGVAKIGAGERYARVTGSTDK